MEYATFKSWLTERGCRFDTQPAERGDGHGTVTIHREGRTAELLLVGARHELDHLSADGPLGKRLLWPREGKVPCLTVASS
jgi:hypothetical protein